MSKSGRMGLEVRPGKSCCDTPVGGSGLLRIGKNSMALG